MQEQIRGRAIFTFSFKLTAPPPRIDTTTVGTDTTYTMVDTSILQVTGDIVQLITGKHLKVLEIDFE